MPILRRCDGPEISIKFITIEDNWISNIVETPNSCGSSLSNFLSGSPTELSLNYLSTSSNNIHGNIICCNNKVYHNKALAMVMEQDFVNIRVLSTGNTSSTHDHEVIFTVCVIPELQPKTEIKIPDRAIPEIAAFFEVSVTKDFIIILAFIQSWIYYDASKFIVYDLDSLHNESAANVMKLYNNTVAEYPYEANKKLMSEKFPDAVRVFRQK